MSRIKEQVFADYNGFSEEDYSEQGVECYGLGVPFDLYDDDTYWLEDTTEDSE